MKLTYLSKKIMGGLFALSLLFVIGVTTSQTVQAQYPDDQYRRDRDYRYGRDRDRDRDYQRRYRRNYDGYPNWGGSFDLRQTALNAGYNEGLKAGRDDARHHRGYGYGFQDSNAYQRATKDYSSRLGDRELYRRYFREAFPNGYADGLRGY